MTKGFYLPDGSFKPIDDRHSVILQKPKEEIIRESKPPQDIDFTPDEFDVFYSIINYFQVKYANKRMQDVFPKMSKEIIDAMEEIGFEVEVDPISHADTEEQARYINECKNYGYMPIEVRIISRIGRQEGDHSKELYEWQHRLDSKRAFPKKRLGRWR